MSQQGHSVTRNTMKTAHGAVRGGRRLRTRRHGNPVTPKTTATGAEVCPLASFFGRVGTVTA